MSAGGLRWGLRRLGIGRGPQLLLIHGTGSSGASWDAVAQRLADRHEVWLPDLPGHGQTDGFADRHASLPRMADALAALLAAQGGAPVLVAGHSAGAAVMLQMALDRRLAPQALLAVNGALAPLPGLAATLFPPLARLIGASDWLPRLAARQAARPAALARLIASTGSRLPNEGVDRYRALLTQESHVRGALDMMGAWQLDALLAGLPHLRQPLWLATGTWDGTVPWEQSARLARRLPTARHVALDGLGHLAHEEAPERIAALVLAMLAETGAPPG
ncbi:alpha/beta fold hydrolase BchO [Leptothrix discophora]|uniref:Alpha/beta fold hydrolase n=1 Tax=Leptothrix discophora TaxID=89 RepID=A0ABT9G4H0_LEPDI|nr:alpha/beta fold hydrolase BchO [Leptothrix discophora]MDP4301387.1 alpha/beta fold hydrolase [Leptothrix discophora]